MTYKYLNTKNQAGFSLMELLVTVAIIGVLSTVGVPMYRRMVSKAKKSEAKVNLGAIANIESLFQSEYGAYGNNLAGMGFAIDGNAATEANMTYGFGFLTVACADLAAVAVAPAAAGNAFGPAINASSPNYYNVAARGRFGRATNGTKNQCGLAATEPAAPNFTGYTVVAAGVIQAGQNVDTSVINDVWTIDQNRQLVNATDGS